MANYSLITGSTSGIGLEVAKELSNSSTNLILHGRDNDKLLKNLELFKEASVITWQFDFDNINDIGISLSKLIHKEKVTISKLVHCAGIDISMPARSLDSNLIDKLMRVNFYSVVEIIRLLLKVSVNGSALSNIIFTSSVSSIRGFPAKSAYGASKAALDAYMLSISKELAPKVIVNSILPAAVPTKLTTNIFANENLKQELLKNYPLGLGSAAQVAKVIAMYHSDDNLWVTGQRVIVDGGSTS